MMSSGWERVGKGSKPKSKKQKKQEPDKMPRQNTEATPLPVESMFGAFEEKPKNPANNQKQPLHDRSNAQASKANKPKKSKPKQPQSSKFRHDTFEEAIRDVSILGVYGKANELRNGQKVWQKDIAYMINDTISCPEGTPAFVGEDFSYPLSKVAKSIKDMLHKLIVDETTDAIRQLLFDHFIRTIKDYTAKDMPTWGYRLCLQSLAHNVPESCTTDLEKHHEEILRMINSPKRCIAIMWTLGQVGVGDVRSGMKVWLEVMMPLLGVKNLAQYVVHYLETLLESCSNPQKDLSGSINADHFVEILKWTFDTSTNLSPSLRDRLRQVYSTVRIIATADPKLKRSIFEIFLRTPTPEISKVQAQFLEVVLECSRNNKACMESWRKSYLSSLPQTKLLLEHIDAKWDECAGKLPKNFEDTVRYFHGENADAAAQSSSMTSAPAFRTVKTLCEKFLDKLERRVHLRQGRRGGIFIPILVALVAIGLTLFMYDVNLHGSVKKSMTYAKLESTGTLNVLQQVWKRISEVLRHVSKWVQANVPYYWSRVTDIFGPYLSYIGSWLQKFFVWIMDVTEPARLLIVSYTKSALIWGNDTFHKISPFMQNVYSSVSPYLVAFYSWLQAKAAAAVSLLRGEIGWCCIRDAIVEDAVFIYESACEGVALVWAYFLYIFKLASDYVSGENM